MDIALVDNYTFTIADLQSVSQIQFISNRNYLPAE